MLTIKEKISTGIACLFIIGLTSLMMKCTVNQLKNEPIKFKYPLKDDKRNNH